MMSNHFNVTSLRADMLSDVAPSRTYGGGALIGNAADVLFLWRSVATQKARGGTLAFYLADDRLETLWRSKERFATEFKLHGIVAAVEPDFSLWSDQPVEEQLHNVRRTRIVSRQFQEHGLAIVPNLNWADEQSFPFCFAGIPQHAPVCMTECRTPGSNDADRRAFLTGLTEGVKQLQPQHVIIYGGTSHTFWLQDRLPPGPTYHLIDAWTDSRGRVRKAQERKLRDRNQPNLFTGGAEWVAEGPQAA
jgi:hypothetical protein